MTSPSTTQGKSSSPSVEVLHLHAGGVDFGDGILGALHGLIALGLAAGERHHIDQSASVEENAAADGFEFGVDLFDQRLALHGGAQ